MVIYFIYSAVHILIPVSQLITFFHISPLVTNTIPLLGISRAHHNSKRHKHPQGSLQLLWKKGKSSEQVRGSKRWPPSLTGVPVPHSDKHPFSPRQALVVRILWLSKMQTELPSLTQFLAKMSTHSYASTHPHFTQVHVTIGSTVV